MYSLLSKRMLKESLLRGPAMRTLSAAPSRAFSNVLNDKEKGDERVFFTKQDGKLTSVFG
jgi:hypothetical protein